MVDLPASLYCLALDTGEHSLYAGGGDGRIFEISLVGPADSFQAVGAVQSGAVGPPAQLPEGVVALEGHTACVHGLALSPGGDCLVSGERPLPHTTSRQSSLSP